MRKCIVFCILLLLVHFIPAQNRFIDSLKQRLAVAKEDTNKVMLLVDLSNSYTWSYADTSVMYAQKSLALAQQLNYQSGIARAQDAVCRALTTLGNYPQSLDYGFKALSLFEKLKISEGIVFTNADIAMCYREQGNYPTGILYARKALQLAEQSHFDIAVLTTLQGILSSIYQKNNELDPAIKYGELAYQINKQWSGILYVLGNAYAKKGVYEKALEYFQKVIPIAEMNHVQIDLLDVYNGMASMYKREGKTDSAIYYASKAVQQQWARAYPSGVLQAANLLAGLYESKNKRDSAVKYYKLTIALKDSLFNQEKTRAIQNTVFNEQKKQQELTMAQQQYKNKVKMYALTGGLIALLVVAFVLYRNNIHKQKAYSLLQQQKQEIETQNAKAQIEAALERVRARAMAMHDSKDVGNVAGALFTELDQLGIVMLRCGIAIVDELNTGMVELWTTVSTKEGKTGQIRGRVNVTIHPMVEGIFNAWKSQQQFFTYELAGKELLDFYRTLSTSNDYAIPIRYTEADRQILSAFYFREGCLFIYTLEPLSQENCQVLQKFTAVFGLTYRRYLDLKQAEEQARKAVREASLDRVRAEIASMRSTDDLQRITPLIWRELTTLKIPFVRCGVYIVDEALEKVHLYLSTPEGHPLGVLHLPINDTEQTRQIIDCWRKGLVYTEHWNKEQFLNWMQSMIDLGQVRSREAYQGDLNPPESLDLHFVPFAQGMLYVGNTAPLTSDEIQLVKSLAEAFAIAYARYEDFKQLEEAKNKVDVTLSELKSTQTQLIQAEKMASLGELTAGIAHEIQNPLNFVKNFSEVSVEQLEELEKAALENNKEEVSAIAADIRNNLQKVVHHQQRAGGIVKSMLEHSRSSKGEKLAVNINALTNEYLLLAFHGMREKDKSFNAIIKTDFDSSIDKINVIPQDIGRVLLNLFNNAFYTVTEKKKQLNGTYEPAVSVNTSKSVNSIIIRVKDNGNGIPQKNIDKIFQPFFTTKPTGEGTGLGLSLSYDIINAHGGELKVKTKEGEYAEFIISLPDSNIPNTKTA